VSRGGQGVRGYLKSQRSNLKTTDKKSKLNSILASPQEGHSPLTKGKMILLIHPENNAQSFPLLFEGGG
jgi:hypothetical protein